MKINNSVIAILLAATLCFTSVSPTLAAETETSGEDTAVTVVDEDSNDEDFTEEEEKDNSDPMALENSENEQERENLESSTLNNPNEVSDSANESSTEETSENEAEEENTDNDSQEIDETATEAYTAEESAVVEEPSDVYTSIGADATTAFAGGSGTQSDPYKVSTADQLDAVRNYPGKYFIQTADIDISGRNWVPIKAEYDSETFYYNGNNKTVSGLSVSDYVTRDGTFIQCIGLFGMADVQNLSVNDAKIDISVTDTGALSNAIGIVAGFGTISNCSAQGTINVTVNSGATSGDIGGIAGIGARVSNCHSEVEIVCTNNSDEEYKVGGICGDNDDLAVSLSYNEGNITVKGTGSVIAGGIGGLARAGKSRISAEKCVNYGDITSENGNAYLGGIFGVVSNNVDVSDCVNFGDVKGDSSNHASGIASCWSADSSFTVMDNYNLGDISGNGNAARIMGIEGDDYSSILDDNYAYVYGFVNGNIPTDRIGFYSPNGMSMGAEGLRNSMAEILDACGCDWDEPEPVITSIVAEGFNVPRDVLSFENSVKDIGVEEKKPYPVNESWYIYFQNHKFTSSEVAAIINKTGSFGGVCAGMTSVVMQNHLNILNLKDVQPDAETLYDLRKPADSNNIQTFIGINHYGLLSPGYNVLQNEFMKNYTNTGALQYLFKLASDIEVENKLVYIDYEECDDPSAHSQDPKKGLGAHAVLVYGIEKNRQCYTVDGEKYMYRLLTIDPNITYNDENDTAENNIYLSKDLDKCVIASNGIIANNSQTTILNYVGSEKNIKNENDFCFQYITNDVSKVLPVGRAKETSNDKYFVFDGKIQMTYVNLNGQKLSNHPGYLGTYYYPDGTDGSSAVVLEKDDYQIETSEGGEFSLYTGDSYITFDSSNGGEVKLSDDNMISVSSSSEFSVSITSDQLPITNEDIVTLSIDGDGADNLQIDYSSEDGINITGGVDEGTKISCESIDKETTYSYTAEEDKSDIIVNVDDELQIEDAQGENNTVIASGACGDNLTYTVKGTENNLTLTISGSGEMYDFDSSSIPWKEYAGQIKSLIIKKGITNIGSHAFNGCSSLNSVVIPDGIITISYRAFANCSELSKVEMPNSVSTVGAKTFENCVNLQTVALSESMSYIPDEMFKGCEKLTSIKIPSSVTRILDNAFKGSGLIEIDIPDSVTTIQSTVFNGCTKLKRIKLPDNLTTVDYGVLSECSSLEELIIPASVTKIYNSAFYGCTSLKTVIFAGDAPVFTKSAGIIDLNDYRHFMGDNITACYPYDNETWTSDVMQDYGGTITWKPYYKDVSKYTITLSPASLPYTGKALKPTVTVDNGCFSLRDEIDYQAIFSDNVNIGTATVSIIGKGIFTGSIEKQFEITARSITPEVLLSKTSFTYTGEIQKPTVTVKDGNTELAESDYDITWSGDCKNAGTYKITVKLKGNYSGTATKTFTIKKATNTITAKSVAKAYSAKAQTFDLGAKAKFGNLTYKSNNKSVTVSKAGKVTIKAKYIGNATITITSPGNVNYTSTTKKIVIKAVPTKTKFTSATNVATRKMALKWVKRSNATGYVIQYSTSSSFASAKTVRIDKYTTVSTTIGNLVKGKKYYVRIKTFKTVSGVKYYSGWSEVKTVAIKK